MLMNIKSMRDRLFKKNGRCVKTTFSFYLTQVELCNYSLTIKKDYSFRIISE